MRKIILVIIGLLFPYFVSSQNNLYDIKQVKGSEYEIASFIDNIGLDNRYTFAVLLPLGSCPRCEVIIPPFYKQVDALFPNEDKLLIVIDDNYNAAIDYLSKHNYGCDKISIIPTNADILNTMYFTVDHIGVPYLMLIDNKTGVIIDAVSSLGLKFDDTFFAEFVSDIDKKRIPLCDKNKHNAKDYNQESIPFEGLIEEIDFSVKSYIVKNIDSVFSSIYKYAVSDRADKIAAIDYLTQNVLLLNLDDDGCHVTSVIKPSEKEMVMFKDENVGDEMYQFLKAMNIPKIFYLDIDFIENDKFLLYSASLPKIYWENIENEQLAYLNQACFIKRKISDINNAEYSTININEESDFSHSNFYYDEETNEVYFPVMKGWPVKGTSSLPENEKDDPANDAFYDSCYSVLKYGLDGNFKKSVLELHRWHRDHETGYYYFKPIVRFDKDYTYIADAFTSIISVLDRNTDMLLREINIAKLLNINIYETELDVNDSITQLELIQSKQELLPINIIDMISHDSELHFVLQYKDAKYYLRLDKNGNIVDMFAIPEQLNGYNIDNIKLFVDNEVSLVSLYYQQNELEIVRVTIDKE